MKTDFVPSLLQLQHAGLLLPLGLFLLALNTSVWAQSAHQHGGMQAVASPVAAEPHEAHTAHANHADQTTDSSADEARDPHAYADGYVRGSGPYALGIYHLGDEHPYAMLLVDRLEWAKTKAARPGVQFDGQWSFGSTYNRVLLQSEGHIEQGKLQEATSEVLWSHAIAPFWNSQLGVRLDKNTGRNRQWLAFGFEGLAPYWFELHAKAYLGQGGRSALRLGGDYDLALNQKWFLQPHVEADFYGQNDPSNGLGRGLSSATAGLRLRYEWRREMAPYVGVERQQSWGSTADLARASGEKTGQTRWFAGVRFWF